MTLTEKLLYLADYIGEERDYEDVEIMRAETLCSMERGLRYALRFTINDLVSRGKAVHLDTVRAYNEYGKDSGE